MTLPHIYVKYVTNDNLTKMPTCCKKGLICSTPAVSYLLHAFVKKFQS